MMYDLGYLRIVIRFAKMFDNQLSKEISELHEHL